MRVHYGEPEDDTTLCGARVLECGAPNAPVVYNRIEGFEALVSKRRCVKCSKMLPLMKARRQRAGQKAVTEWLHNEMANELKKRLLDDLDYTAHEAVFGVPCGPTLSMIKTAPVDAPTGAPDLYDNLMERTRSESLHSS